jgi:hypothetical protein
MSLKFIDKSIGNIPFQNSELTKFFLNGKREDYIYYSFLSEKNNEKQDFLATRGQVIDSLEIQDNKSADI